MKLLIPTLGLILAFTAPGAVQAEDAVLAHVPKNICQTDTEQDPLCSDDVLENWLSGGVCNMVAQGFLLNVPSADFAIQNRGGCRTDILAGTFTVVDAREILPFSNTLVTFKMTGSQIKALLEDGVEAVLNFDSSGSYPMAAGLRYEIDYTKPRGERVMRVEMSPKLGPGQWTPLDMEREFEVVTNSFLGGGNDGYSTFEEVADSMVDTAIRYAESFVNFAEVEMTLLSPPLAVFSTQAITLEDDTRYPPICSGPDATVQDDEAIDMMRVKCGASGLIGPCGKHVFKPRYSKENLCPVAMKITEWSCMACNSDSQAVDVRRRGLCEAETTNEDMFLDLMVSGGPGTHISYSVEVCNRDGSGCETKLCTVCVTRPDAECARRLTEKRGTRGARGGEHGGDPALAYLHQQCSETFSPEVDMFMC